MAYKRSDGPDHTEHFGGVRSFKGWRIFAKRTTLLSSLVNGALVIKVRMKLATPTKSVPPPFIPENPVAKIIQRLFMEYKSADIVFEATQITGVSPDVFRLLLFYMYGGKLSDNDMKSHPKELVDAANRFGVVNLKLETEAYIVGATTFHN